LRDVPLKIRSSRYFRDAASVRAGSGADLYDMPTRIRSRPSLVEMLEPRQLLSSYYVSTAGSNANPGTSAAPFRTIQAAANVASAGDVVTVRAGKYAGFSVGWDVEQDGTAAKPITFKAEPGVVITSKNAHTPDGINIEGADYIIIDGFTIKNTSGRITRAGIRSVTNTNCVIIRNRTDGCGTWGIFTSFSENVRIEHNTTLNSRTQHGIYVSNSADNPSICNNVIFGNQDCGIHINGDASQGGDGTISGVLIEGNIIHDNGTGGGSAINLDGVQDSMIRNNLIYNNHASGISLYRIDAAEGAKDNTIVNNTIVMASNARWAVNISGGSTGTVVFNNILLNNHRYRGAISIDDDSRGGFSSDYNVTADRFTTDGGDSILSLAQWRSATGQDAHSIVATSPSALFANLARNDYRLSSGSAAIDKGTQYLANRGASFVDIIHSGRGFGEKTDVGAYEYAHKPKSLASAIDLGRIIGGRVRALTGSVNAGSGAVLYRFTVPTATRIQIKLTNLTNEASIEILNSAGRTIRSADRSGTHDEVTSPDLWAGTFYVRVIFNLSVGGTSYRLRVAGS
jgi:parallel beta-helix repeat protein